MIIKSVMFGLTRGEIVLVAFIFALVYGAGLLPKLVALVSRRSAAAPEDKSTDE